mgnify:CR=1 FL=1
MPPVVPMPPNRNPGTGTVTPPNPRPNPNPAPFDKVAAAKVLDIGETEIAGGHNNPVSRDYAPEGGILIGFEIGVGPRFNRSEVAALRPIYKVGDKETNGEGFGDLADRAERGRGLTRAFHPLVGQIGRQHLAHSCLSAVALTRSLSTCEARNTSTRLGRIGTSSPVLGLRPMRWDFWRTAKVPNSAYPRPCTSEWYRR